LVGLGLRWQLVLFICKNLLLMFIELVVSLGFCSFSDFISVIFQLFRGFLLESLLYNLPVNLSEFLAKGLG
jgi:hypothetical protein